MLASNMLFPAIIIIV